MWQQLLDFARQAFGLLQEVRRLRVDLVETQQELERTNERAELFSQALQQLATGLEHLSETERLERQNLMLRLENELLRFRQSLPPAPHDERDVL